MTVMNSGNWKPVELDSLVADVVDALESGDIDSAFDNIDLHAGNFARAKNTRDFTKNYIAACIRAGLKGIREANEDTTLGLINAYRRMNAEPPLEEMPEGYRVFAIKMPSPDGIPDVEIFIMEGSRVLYGEKVLPRGILTENFLEMTGVNLF